MVDIGRCGYKQIKRRVFFKHRWKHNIVRVALVSSSSGSRGGGELYLCGLAMGLVKLGVEVCSVLANHPRMDELERSLIPFGPVHRILYRNTYDRPLRSVGAVIARREILRLSQELARLPVDVLHLNKQNLEDGLDLLIAAEKSAIPVVTTIHVTRTMQGLKSLGGSVRDLISRRVLKRTSAPVIAIAQSGAHDLAALQLPLRRVNLVWNGVPPAPAANRERIRAAWKCRAEDIVLGCVARIEAQKNPLFFPYLLARLPQHVRLVWIGDGSLRGPMEEAVQAAEVADRVLIAGWRQDARSLMAGFDVFVLPSLYEGFPLAILEAMAAGLPCVVSDVDGVAEAVEQGQTGFLCPVNDESAWLTTLQGCLERPQLLSELGRCGRERYLARFSVEAMARNTLSVYHRLIQQRKTDVISGTVS